MGAENIIIADKEADQRLDKWIKSRYPGVPFHLLNKWLRTGQIRVNSKRAKNSTKLMPGDKVRLPPQAFSEQSLSEPKKTFKNKPLSAKDVALAKSWVIYEDSFVIAFNKPYGLASQGGTGTDDHLDRYLEAFQNPDGEKPKLVHRLDKHTAGVLIVAKDRQTAKHLMHAFQQEDVQKTYIALVMGVPSPLQGEIKNRLSKLPTKAGEKVMRDDADGRIAITRYEVLDTAVEVALVKLMPQTGRMHQLRVHMQDLGTPIFGDGKYGGANKNFPDLSKYLHLCAREISFKNPEGRKITIKADLPPHMNDTLKYFGFKI